MNRKKIFAISLFVVMLLVSVTAVSAESQTDNTLNNEQMDNDDSIDIEYMDNDESYIVENGDIGDLNAVGIANSTENLNIDSKNSSVQKIVAQSSSQTTFSVNDIVAAARLYHKYYNIYGIIRQNVQVGSVTVNYSQFYYLVCQATYNLFQGRTGNIILPNVIAPNELVIGAANGTFSRQQYAAVAHQLANSIKTNGKVPSRTNSSLGTLGVEEVLDIMTRALTSYSDNGVLPSSMVYESKRHYLVPTVNCQSDDLEVISLARAITKNLTSMYDKAEAIFNWFKSKVSYKLYSNTVYGAKATLTRKIGNCCDQAHALIALMRASGIPARYAHNSGLFGGLGHVWVQVYVSGKWMNIDTTGSSNTFTQIRNFNVPSSYRIYKSLPF